MSPLDRHVGLSGFAVGRGLRVAVHLFREPSSDAS